MHDTEDEKKYFLFVFVGRRVCSVRRMHIGCDVPHTLAPFQWHRVGTRAISVFLATYEFGSISRTADVQQSFWKLFSN